MNYGRVLHGCWIVIGLALVVGDVAVGEDVARYRLAVGEQFVFHCDRTEIRTGSGAMNSVRHSDWKVDVVAHNADGSWHVVDLVDSGGTVHEDNMTIPYERVVEAGDCDLYPDGVVRGDDDPLVNLPRLFPRLPANVGEGSGGWDDQSEDHSRMVHFKAVTSEHPAQMFSFVGQTTGGITGVFEPGSGQTYQFDLQLGVVDDIQLTAGADPSFTEKGEIRRVATKQLDPAAIAKIAGAASEYDRALVDYKKAVVSGAVDQTLKATQAGLQQGADAFIACTFNDGGAGKESLKDAVNGMVSDLPSQHDILNQPAPDWTASGVDGSVHSLKDFRGKVVLLDFGSRGCSWCIREMPQLIRLSQDFKDQPVAIVGMDLDTEAADVKFVVNALRPPYLTLMASEAAKGYPIEGTPTVVIVDQNGVMRRRIIGYTTSGYDEMKAAIQSLLPTKG